MSGHDIFQTSGYKNMRNRKKTLILDINDSDNTHLGSGTEFNIVLREPLIVDKHSEVYLDNFLTFNCNLGDTHNHSAFVLKINEFNVSSGIASNTSSNTIQNGIIIPNDNNNTDNYFSTVVHKGKKFNYICDINPQTIYSLSGKITDLSGDPIFHGASLGTKYIYALTGIDTWGVAAVTPERALFKGDALTSMTPAGGTASGTTTRILTNTVQGASTIYFTSEDDLDLTEWHAVDIECVVGANATTGSGAYTFTISIATNPSLIVLKENGRFISEFSIIARE